MHILVCLKIVVRSFEPVCLQGNLCFEEEVPTFRAGVTVRTCLAGAKRNTH